MTVSNGQLANQTTFNTAFVSRTQDTNTVGRLDLQNVLAASGANVINAQREINSLNAFTGRPSGSNHDATPVWLSNELGTSTDTLKARIEAIDAEFDPATGHTHDGTAGQGGPISASDLNDLNYFTAEWQYIEVTGVSGSTFDVSSDFGSFFPGGNSVTEGVITDPPDNRVSLIDLANGTNIIDSGGQVIYGRITEASSVWTLSFFTNEAGVETASTIASSTNIGIFYRRVFTLDTKPTITADIGALQSLDFTADIVDASTTVRGAVSIGTQSFAGDKTFTDFLKANAELHLDLQNDNATGSNQTLTTPTKSIVRLTNASLVSIEGITAPSHAQVIALFNLTTVDLTIINDTGTAANRILTGTGNDFNFKQDSAVLLIYDLTSARWRMVGGGGGASARVVSTFTGTSVTPAEDGDETFLYNGGSAQTFSTTGFGTLTALTEGKRITLMGSSDTNTLYIAESDISDGRLMNGDFTLTKGAVIEFEYNSTLARMVEIKRNG